MIKRVALMLLAVVIAISLFSFPVLAQNDKVVYDYAKVLGQEDISRINEAANRYFADNGCSVYIVTAPFYGYWGEDFLEENPGVDKNSVILILSCNSSENYDMYTYGKCDRLISNGEVDIILDDPDVFDNIKYEGDYTSAAIRFIELSAEACTPEIALAIVVGIIFGLVAAITVFVFVITSYRKKQRSEKYPLDRFARLDITESRDMFAGTFITKRVIQSNRSRGGGGGRSGGGGGHRGGR